MENWKNHLFLKIFVILIIGLILLIPTTMIQNMILERKAYRAEAIHEISSKWGEEQTLSGPILMIPYSRFEWRTTGKEGEKEKIRIKDELYILPDDLETDGSIAPEKRYRGIYEVVVYQSKLKMKGVFKLPDLSSLDIDPELVEWTKAKVLVGISDLKGIDEKVLLTWQGVRLNFQPGLPNDKVLTSGIQTPVTVEPSVNSYSFESQVSLRGSENLFCLPVGRTSRVTLTSTWPDPKFTGSILPKVRHVDDKGFQASWNVLDLNRNYPQFWTGSNHQLNDATLGIELLTPVDSYQKAYRSARYAILFVALTFLAFFFVEVLKDKRIHPVQYGLVGAALVIFYTLLLSISEHLTFNIAYIVAAVATILLITLYVASVLGSRSLAGMISLVLTTLYSFLFITLQLQDYALLMGSIGLFVILSIVMYFSRKVNWDNRNVSSGTDSNASLNSRDS